MEKPFRKKNFRDCFDCNKTSIIKGFLASFALLLPVVFYALGIESKAALTPLALLVLSPFFFFNKKDMFWFGGFSSILWFYWVGLSFRYYDMLWMFAPMTILGFLYYGVLFLLIGLIPQKLFFLRALAVAFIFDYLSPFGFDWLKPEILTANTYFGAEKLDILLLLCGIGVAIHINGYFKALSIIFLALSITLTKPQIEPSIKIKLVSTSIEQDTKWDDNFKRWITLQNFKEIDSAANSGYGMVVLPETAFPYFLDDSEEITEALKQKSLNIAIVAGGLSRKNNRTYNSTYVFYDGSMKIIDKMVAVPFGEVNPLPPFASKIVNELFFNGAEDYKTAEKPGNFNINGVTFRNAICYEATNEKIYLDSPKFVIASSNNGWFVPSLEPFMQKLLMIHFSKKYKTVIYHATNKSEPFVIK